MLMYIMSSYWMYSNLIELFIEKVKVKMTIRRLRNRIENAALDPTITTKEFMDMLNEYSRAVNRLDVLKSIDALH